MPEEPTHAPSSLHPRPPRRHRPADPTLLAPRSRPRPPPRTTPPDREAGQSTVEYALVILAAAALALLVVAWAARTGRIGELFDQVIDSVSSKVA